MDIEAVRRDRLEFLAFCLVVAVVLASSVVL